MTILTGVLTLLILIWSAYSITGLVLVIPPFRSRGWALQSLGLSVFLLMALMILMSGFGQTRKAMEAVLAPVDDVQTSQVDDGAATSAEVRTCATIDFPESDVARISADVALLAGPDVNAARLRNEALSRAVGEERFFRVDEMALVRRLCAANGWVQIEVLSPGWMAKVRGWVPQHRLIPVAERAAGSIHGSTKVRGG